MHFRLAMLAQKTFIKKTRRGNIIKVVREHYLRDDIWCGSPLCQVLHVLNDLRGEE